MCFEILIFVTKHTHGVTQGLMQLAAFCNGCYGYKFQYLEGEKVRSRKTKTSP